MALLTFALRLGSICIRKADITQNRVFLVVIKNIVYPLVAFCIDKYLFKLKSYCLYFLVIIAFAPTAFFVYFMAKQFSNDPFFAKQVVGIRFILSLLSLIFISVVLIGRI